MTSLTPEQLNARLITTEKTGVRIGDLIGRSLVLAFFPAAFTSVCTTELCGFRDNSARLNGLNAQVYGISIDLPATLSVFAEQNGLNFPLLSDCNREAIHAFDVVWPLLWDIVRDVANRAIFIIDGDGRIVYRWVAEKPGNVPPFDEVFATLDGGQS